MGNCFTDWSEKDIWRAFKAGHDDAYEYIYTRFSAGLYNYGRHLSKDRQLVEDCLQDLFIHLYQHRATLGETDSIKYYLFRALRRRIAEAAGRQGKFETEENELTAYNFEITHSPEARLIEEQSALMQQEEIRKAVNQLPRRQREIIYLLFFNGLSHQEIASIMAIEIRTVYNQVHNALEILRNYFQKFHKVLLVLLLSLTALL